MVNYNKDNDPIKITLKKNFTRYYGRQLQDILIFSSIKVFFMFKKGCIWKIRFLLLLFLEIATKKTFNLDLRLGSQDGTTPSQQKLPHARFLWIPPNIITFKELGIFYFWQLLDCKISDLKGKHVQCKMIFWVLKKTTVYKS